MSDPKRRRTGDEDISELRRNARQTYLAQREAQQLALLRRQVAEEAEEEERLGSKLSVDERRDFARNRETLRLAEARNAIDEHLDGYLLPDADGSRSAVLTKRHNEREKGYDKSEVQLWEDEQMSKIKSQVKKPERVNAEDYEFVFSDEMAINFQSDGMPDPDKALLERQLKEAEQKVKTMEEVRKNLPIYAYRDELLSACESHPVLIIVAETGSGKTTQVPQYLHEKGFTKNGKVGCTQPRRVAAMSVAKRVSEEMGVRLGRECGYSVRFDSKITPEVTKVEYLTDGLMLKQLMSDPLLSEYSAVVLDEAHERSLATDLLMSLLKELVAVRPEFRLLVTSATLNATKFSDYFGGAPLFNIPGRTHPIERLYSSSPEANYLNAAVTTVFQIHLSQGPGDILVFFTGSEEIESAGEYILETSRKLGSKAGPIIVAPVYGALPAEDQQKIFAPTPPGHRKIVLSTNIAETSLTIDGIRYCIDCGLEKQSVYDHKRSMNTLVVVPCSRASAEQRAGRAGRTGPGMCFRLYTKYAFYNELQMETEPEILRCDLDGPMLTLKTMGINDLLNFDFIDPPSTTAIAASLEHLYALGYIDSAGKVTKIGRRASELPLDPKLGKALLAADKYGCVEEMVTLVSMVSEAGTLFFAPKDKKVAADLAKQRFSEDVTGGDLLAFLKIWNEFVENEFSQAWAKENFLDYRALNRVRNVRDQLQRLCDKVELPHSSVGIADHVKILKAFTSGYFTNVARLNRDGQSYSTVSQKLSVFIHPSSCMARKQTRDRWIVFYELTSTSKEWVRSVAPIQPEWLTEVAPHYHKAKNIEDLTDKKQSKGTGRVGTGR
ncbi:hypothetical protein N0V86_001222 [Didymella sp. IMI 355093]|nr:hypothetical protein N0V86_001222 [Didymella sp. IMI 355093]